VDAPWRNSGDRFRFKKQILFFSGFALSLGRHIVHYGFDFNHVPVFGFAPICSLAPCLLTNVGASEQAFAEAGPFPGGVSDPPNYPVESVTVSNGLGYYSPKPGLGMPAGAFFPNRLTIYVGDSWKLKKNVTLSYGLRYVRETGRTIVTILPFLSSMR
jgi:hypothetical protein